MLPLLLRNPCSGEEPSSRTARDKLKVFCLLLCSSKEVAAAVAVHGVGQLHGFHGHDPHPAWVARHAPLFRSVWLSRHLNDRDVHMLATLPFNHVTRLE